MKLTFLGTRGQIEARSRRHYRHSSLLIECGERRVQIDRGADWREELVSPEVHAVVLTHSHPDHAAGLQGGSDVPVHATAQTWQRIDDYPIKPAFRQTVAPRSPREIEGITFEAFPVQHSLNHPAVGYRMSAGRSVIFYCPDVVAIRDSAEALGGIDVYIGDGAAPDRPIIKHQDGQPTGHTTIRTELDWCAEHGVPRAIFTHCGSAIVAGDEDGVTAQLDAWAGERNMAAQLAYDGFTVTLP